MLYLQVKWSKRVCVIASTTSSIFLHNQHIYNQHYIKWYTILLTEYCVYALYF